MLRKREENNYLRERFDFQNVSNIIIENAKREMLRNETYFDLLFEYAFWQSEKVISVTDRGNINKVLNGSRAIPKDIVEVYSSVDCLPHLKKGVSNVLENVFDVGKVSQEIHDLLLHDMTLTEKRKYILLKNREDDISFITDCIFATIARNSITRKKVSDRYIPEKEFELADYLVNYHFPRVSKNFYGRDMELEAIHQQLTQEEFLFLHGIGGIGKTELVKHYGKQYQKEYEHVLYLPYRKNLYQTILQLEFIDDTQDKSESEKFEMHYRFFKRLNERTLVILDNFDCLPEQEELFQEFLNLSFKLLVTTRNKLNEVPCYLVKEIAQMEDLKAIFYTYAPQIDEKQEILEELIEMVYRHTLTVEIIAKTSKAVSLKPSKLLEELKNDRLHFSSENKIRVQKDTVIQNAVPREHIIRLFQLQNLSAQKQSLLQHLLLIPRWGISKDLFGKWLDIPTFNDINELIDYGWIQEEIETSKISMHPFIHEVIKSLHAPSFKDNKEFLKRLGDEYIVEIEEEIDYHDLLNLTRSIFDNIKINDKDLAFELLEKILRYLRKKLYYKTMEAILNIMEQIIFEEDNSMKKATYEFYRGLEKTKKSEFEQGEPHFKTAISYFSSYDKNNAELALEIHKELYYYYFSRDNEKALEHAKIIKNLTDEYQNSDSIEIALNNFHLMCAKSLNDESMAKDLASLLETSEVKAVQKEFKQAFNPKSVREDLISELQKIDEEELIETAPKDFQDIFQNVCLDLKELTTSDNDSLSLMNIFERIINTTFEQLDKKK